MNNCSGMPVYHAPKVQGLMGYLPTSFTCSLPASFTWWPIASGCPFHWIIPSHFFMMRSSLVCTNRKKSGGLQVRGVLLLCPQPATELPCAWSNSHIQLGLLFPISATVWWPARSLTRYSYPLLAGDSVCSPGPYSICHLFGCAKRHFKCAF